MRFDDAAVTEALLSLAVGDGLVQPGLREELVRRGLLRAGTYADLTAEGTELAGLFGPSQLTVRDFALRTRTLRRVVPVASEAITTSGDRVVVTSVELWSNAVVVTWLTIGIDFVSPLTEGGHWGATGWLTDADGNEHPQDGGQGGGGPYVYRCTSTFRFYDASNKDDLLFTPGAFQGDAATVPVRLTEPFQITLD